MPFPDWVAASSEEANFLRLVLDHVSDCLVVVDTSGTIVLMNQPYCHLLGGEEADFIGRHITDVVGPQTRLHLVARGEGSHVGYPLKVRGHQLITKQVPVLRDGRIVGAVGMALFSDVDALKKTYSRVSQSGLAIHRRSRPWTSQFTIEDIIGQGERMTSYRHSLKVAAEYELPVLIYGETGSGKELAAHSIHGLSDRAAGPFVWINCASIPSELIEAELFGYEGGAFTGARSQGKVGKFELAAGGTLFLDEIGDMPLHLQSSLLRVLQTNKMVRVGGIEPVEVDVRIICATNRPLQDLIGSGQFRRDLYFRLDVLPITVPALRERDDLEFLLERLLERIAGRLGKEVRTPSAEQVAMLLAHPWPGNVRELESVLTRYLITGQVVLTSNKVQSASATETTVGSLKQRKAALMLAEIQAALQKTGGDKRRAAGLLGISRAQLYKIIKSHAADQGGRTAT